MQPLRPSIWSHDSNETASRKPGALHNALMDEVCVGRGWCGGIVDGQPSHVDDFIPESGPVTADQFVEWLFMADDMDPKEDPSKWQKHEQGLREAFIRHMGHDIVDASLLKWALD